MNDNSYTNWHAMSDKALIRQIGSYVRHHRLQQNRTQEDVANAAGISRSTLSLLERGEPVTLLTFIQVLRVLDLLHLMNSFEVKQRMSPIERAKLDQKKRKRASSPKGDGGRDRDNA